MKNFATFVILLFYISSCKTSKPGYNPELIVCGGSEVYILDIKDKTSPLKIWSWQAGDCPDLPKEYVPLFRSTDECKPVNDGKEILITSSSGGVALVDRKSKKLLFYGKGPMAHSAEYLPGGRIAVACSHTKGGDCLQIFDIRQPGKELFRVPLEWGHGVVWDRERELLYALSGGDIQTFKLTDWKSAAPALTKVSSVGLPERMGHELQPVSGTPYLRLSTDNHCWYFNRNNNQFTLHPMLEDKSHVKCISEHPETGQIAYVHGEKGHWWSENIRFVNPDAVIHLKGKVIYKVRWSTSVN